MNSELKDSKYCGHHPSMNVLCLQLFGQKISYCNNLKIYLNIPVHIINFFPVPFLYFSPFAFSISLRIIMQFILEKLSGLNLRKVRKEKEWSINQSNQQTNKKPKSSRKTDKWKNEKPKQRNAETILCGTWFCLRQMIRLCLNFVHF